MGIDSQNSGSQNKGPRGGQDQNEEIKIHNFDEGNDDEIWFEELNAYTGISPQLDYEQIAKIKCEIAYERRDWPDPIPAANTHNMIAYTLCKQAATHNMLGPRSIIQTENRLEAWSELSTGHPDDPWIIDGIYYGFPLQYRGEAMRTTFEGNHPSANKFPQHVAEYIKKELAYGGLLGPFHEPPFRPWCHIAPLMTRDKATSTQRRVIVDLTYPEGAGPNAKITKNHIFGCSVVHRLPTVDDAIQIIVSYDFRVMVASLDIARAYRNFALDPYDWPLTCVSHMGDYYIDIRMPFGSRLSSLHMQRIALFLQRALRALGVIALIYLDDVLLICPPGKNADDIFATARSLVRRVGLPIAWDKLVSPCKIIRFLGIIIDCDQREIRIPQQKVDSFIRLAIETKQKKFISRKEIQSIAGHVNYLGKAVCPARLFMNRILALLRSMKGRSIRISQQMCEDLNWFITFLPQYNGRSLIIHGPPAVYMEVDSSLMGGGGWCGSRCYSYRYPREYVRGWSISELETYNCLLAARIFLSDTTNTSVQIKCDNNAAVISLSAGTARDKNILAVCRAFWFLAAKNNIRFLFVHAPGATMTDADILSRRFNSLDDATKADRLISRRGFVDIHVLSHIGDIDSYF